MVITEELSEVTILDLLDPWWWTQVAACKDSPVDWFDEASADDDHREAANVCRSCPVVAQCRMQADRDKSSSGVWGGRLWKSRDATSSAIARRDSAIEL